MKKKILIILVIVLLIAAIGGFLYYKNSKDKPEETLNEYISKINDEKYNEMYELLDEKSKQKITEEDFVSRNKKIYQGIDMSNMTIKIKDIKKSGSKRVIIYNTKMDASGGEITFDNEITLNNENGYKIEWSSNLIFPELEDTDKVRVSTSKPSRGKILDRNGKELAGEGTASSIGIVPGKLSENKDEDINKIAELLGTTADTINKKLQAGWVTDESFVPLKTISSSDTELKDKLLQIKGVKISSTKVRYYSLGEAASQLTGYVQTITKEELEKNEGYTSTSLIGKSGLEQKYEEKLKGKNGVEIYIEDKDGKRKQTLIKQDKVDGEDVKLTIDSNLQQKLYNELKNDEGLFVVMNPSTGEILALVSTPSVDVNKMVLGVSTDEWNEISNDEKTPMLARYSQKYCPGSTFKPITGAIGLSTNSLSVDDTFSYSGLSWQKDASWGTYNITTLTAYNGEKNLKNALIHSDNIYFAQAALKIGNKNMTSGLDKLKFNADIDFDINLAKSQYSNDGKIDKETLLADTGYGQGQILINPVHMASIYSAFYNEGNMIKPYLEFKENKEPTILVENAFTKEASEEIKNDLIQVVENPEGTAKDMKINEMTIAGKTGTAELKASKDEKADTIGWFDCFTVNNDNPYLFIGMVEKANNNGGSHYLIPMIKRAITN
mgnify:FL=1